MVRITTWNVNGVRNPFGHQPWRENRTFNAMFDILEADIVIMQELKIQRKDLTDDMVLIPGWDCFFSLPKHKKGYSGVGVFTRHQVCAPIRAEEGVLGVLYPPKSPVPYRLLPTCSAIGGYPDLSEFSTKEFDAEALDAEGRCVVLEFPAFVLFGVYSPANSNGLRDGYRSAFLVALDMRIRNLRKMGKSVILTGDLNISRDSIDTAKAEDTMKAERLTYEQYLNQPNRRIFNQLLLNGKIPGERDKGRDEPVLYDLCREFHPHREGMFTHWDQKINARPGNFGSRIDFILCSNDIKDWFIEANIQEGLMGSDHCPVYAILKDKISFTQSHNTLEKEIEPGKIVHVIDMMNAPDMFKHGIRLRDFDPATDLLLLSGRLLPEFANRRSIRDMFSKKPIPAVSTYPSSSSLQATISSSGPGEDILQTNKETNTMQRLGYFSSKNRRAFSSKSPSKVTKRSKVNQPSSVSNSSRSQCTLQSFFQTRVKSVDLTSTSDEKSSSNWIRATQNPSLEQSGQLPNSQKLAQSVSFHSDPRATQEASKEGWTKLFSRKITPRCEHGDPCIVLTTKKDGINFGRQFWMCSRPIGPSGQKEIGTQWRCGTFIWASDWKGS